MIGMRSPTSNAPASRTRAWPDWREWLRQWYARSARSVRSIPSSNALIPARRNFRLSLHTFTLPMSTSRKMLRAAFDRQREDVADAALRLDCAWRTRIDLQFTPQPKDLDVDAPAEDIFVN